jgi:hypothetical protein
MCGEDERTRNNEIYSSLILRLPEIRRSASHPPPPPTPPPPSPCPRCLLVLKRKSLNHFIENISPCEKCQKVRKIQSQKENFCYNQHNFPAKRNLALRKRNFTYSIEISKIVFIAMHSKKIYYRKSENNNLSHFEQFRVMLI